MQKTMHLLSVLSLNACPFLCYKLLETKTVNAALLVAKLYIAVKILAVKLYFHVY